MANWRGRLGGLRPARAAAGLSPMVSALARRVTADRAGDGRAGPLATGIVGRSRPLSTDLTSRDEPPTTRVTIDPHSVWRAGWILVAVIALTLMLQFVVTDGAPVLYPLVMAFFASIAMEPAVSRLSRWVPRGVAAAVTMLLALAGLATFLTMFGGLLRDQIVQFATSVPAITASMVSWVNETFGTDFDTQTLLDRAQIDTARITDLATNLAGGLVGVLTSVLSAALTLFAFLFFTFYLSADAVRLRRWVASMFPPRHQVVVLTFWELALTKIGGYVGARLVLAVICGTFTSTFLLIVGMPYWLPLGIWTGVIAQFVPTIGTYLGILLPVLVGLGSDDPRKGLYVLIFAVIYQQIENLTFEPRISAKAVSVHPAVSFGSAILGGSLFGPSGALVGVPTVAALIAMFDIYKRRWELSEAAAAQAVAAASQASTSEDEQQPDADEDEMMAARDRAEEATPSEPAMAHEAHEASDPGLAPSLDPPVLIEPSPANGQDATDGLRPRPAAAPVTPPDAGAEARPSAPAAPPG